MTEKYLVLLDVDKIYNYVFATNKLKEIRGASAILANLNLAETEVLCKSKKYKYEKIFIGGGSGKIIFHDIDNAKKFCKELEEIYRKRTNGDASITTAIVDYDEINFKKSIYHGEKELRKNKDSKYNNCQLMSDHYFKTCESSGILPAEILDEDGINRKFISSAIHKKREEAKKVSNLFFDDFNKYIKNSALEDKIKNKWEVLFSKSPDDKSLPEDINSIGEFSDRYIGLIYADGNRIGQKLQELSSEKDYAEFSNCILESINQSIFESLAENLEPAENFKTEKYFPFEILLIGGDDVLVVVPADKAIKIAIDFCENFKRKTKAKLPDKNISISAGVVITHANYPMHKMIDYAEQLLKIAKRKGNENPDEEENHIDFMINKGALLNEVNDIRDEEYSYSADDISKINLLQRPYKTKDLNNLIQKISNLKNSKFPHSRLKQMYKSLFRGKNQAMLDYCLLLSRLDEKTSRKIIKEEFFDECGLFPWVKTSRGLETPFVDLIELYDFVE